MPRNYNKEVLESYTALFTETLKQVRGIANSPAGKSLPSVEKEYPCKHSPCCDCCWFSSALQEDFEDTVILLMGTMRVDVKELIKTIEKNADFTNIQQRFMHFYHSPKYQIIFEHGKNIIFLNQESIFYQAVISVTWSNYYQHNHKLGDMKVGKFSLIRRRSIDSNGTYLHNTCAEKCNFGPSYSEIPRMQNYRQSTIYTCASPTRSDFNVVPNDEDDVEDMRPFSPTRAQRIWEESQGGQKNKKRKGILRQSTGYPRFNSSTNLSEPLGETYKKRVFLQSPNGIEDTSTDERPPMMKPLQAMKTGRSIGGGLIHTG